MIKYAAQISAFILTLICTGCFDPPEFSDTPRISFESLTFDEDDFNQRLRLSFEFEDGNGDIGIPDNNVPYHSHDIIVDAEDKVVTLNADSLVLPFYSMDPTGARELFSETDNRPPYSCLNYEGDPKDGDPVFIRRNEFHHNFHIQFLKKRRGEYSEIDLFSEFNSCETFNGRIPVFEEELQGGNVNGTITYNITSTDFRIFLQTDTFKISFFIYDQALNKSNVVETPDYAPLELLGLDDN